MSLRTGELATMNLTMHKSRSLMNLRRQLRWKASSRKKKKTASIIVEALSSWIRINFQNGTNTFKRAVLETKKIRIRDLSTRARTHLSKEERWAKNSMNVSKIWLKQCLRSGLVKKIQWEPKTSTKRWLYLDSRQMSGSLKKSQT